MKHLICNTAAIVALTLSVGSIADTSEGLVQVSSLAVKDRIQSLELINVTSENPIAEEAAAPDLELAAILDEIAALETVEVE